MNQTQRLIDSIRDAPHDAVIVAGMFAIPVLIALWIVNRMRHPERGLLHALVIASVGFVLVPCVSSAVLILWVRRLSVTRVFTLHACATSSWRRTRRLLA